MFGPSFDEMTQLQQYNLMLAQTMIERSSNPENDGWVPRRGESALFGIGVWLTCNDPTRYPTEEVLECRVLDRSKNGCRIKVEIPIRQWNKKNNTNTMFNNLSIPSELVEGSTQRTIQLWIDQRFLLERIVTKRI